MIRIVLVGASGRMGRAIEAAASGAPNVEIVARVDQRERIPAGAAGWTDDTAAVLQPGTVAVEFSSAAGAVATAALCAARGIPLVSGSTGLTAAEDAAVRAAGGRAAVLRASNFSIGIAALRRALVVALQALPATWDVEIVERHHRMKRDSPSGTALTLADDALAVRGLGRDALRQGREGVTGARSATEIGVHSVRGGTWVGDHAILLAGEGESLELRHVAQDRAAFAFGALAAARFVAAAPHGVFGMDDVLA
jgi:4-hydroxy-tetrahydrodipicolinate reductase